MAREGLLQGRGVVAGPIEIVEKGSKARRRGRVHEGSDIVKVVGGNRGERERRGCLFHIALQTAASAAGSGDGVVGSSGQCHAHNPSFGTWKRGRRFSIPEREPMAELGPPAQSQTVTWIPTGRVAVANQSHFAAAPGTSAPRGVRHG